MADKEKIKCSECGRKNTIKKGKRKSKYETVQKYLCYDCKKYFTLKKLEKKVYPAKVVMQAVSYYNLGYTIRDTAKLVNKKYKVKITKSTVNFRKVFYHQQPYKFQYHKAKVELFINEYYEFNPNQIVLMANADIPSWKKKEFVFDNKAGWFYTSKYFQKIRNIGKKIQVTKIGQESDEDWT